MSGTGWHTRRMAAFDVETTGVDVETAHIVTATVGFVGGKLATTARSWLINPGVDIPDAATAVHGITTAHAQEYGEPPATATFDIARVLRAAWYNGYPVVAFNAAYDLTVLDRELGRHNQCHLEVAGPVIDPFVIDRHVDPYRKGKRTLTACCEHYKVRLDGAHNATSDAIAGARLAWRIASIHAEIAAMSPEELTTVQAVWHGKRQADFAAYLRRTGKAAEADGVDGHWPIRPRPANGEVAA